MAVRQLITREKLEDFITEGKAIVRELQSGYPTKMSQEEKEELFLERLNKACKFLKAAHNANIINLNTKSFNKMARKGVHIVEGRSLSGIDRRYIAPKSEQFSVYSGITNQARPKVYTAAKFFADATRNVIKTAEAIRNEKDRPNQVSSRITVPVRRGHALAKLAA